MITRAVLAACDGRDGVRDGFLNDPRACAFDVATLQCTGAETEACLTAPQLATVKRAYAPMTRSNGEMVFAGKVPGSESAWGMVSGTPDTLSMVALQIAHSDAAWDPKNFDLERDLALAIEKVGYAVNAIDPDLRKFKARGGKLLLYHGWNDGLISAGNTVDYFESVRGTMGRGQDDWLRLFMVPGMGHCQGGAGPDQVNWFAPLERWRESGKAPDRIEAAKVVNNRIEMTRPLCPVSADRPLFRRRQHQRRRQLRLQGAVERRSSLAALRQSRFLRRRPERNHQQHQRRPPRATPAT